MIVEITQASRPQEIVFDVEDELQFHVEMLERKYTQQGMSSCRSESGSHKTLRKFRKSQAAVR